MPKIKLEGMEKLQVKLKKSNGAALQESAQRKVPVDTGNLKRSIGLEIRDSGLTAEVEPTAEYAAYVEYGTRYMNAQPYMRPSYTAQKEKFKSDLKKLTR